MERAELLKKISIDSEVCFGKPCIQGSRLWVSLILDQLAAGIPVEEIMEEYPQLTREDILACMAYSAEMSRERFVDVPFEQSTLTNRFLQAGVHLRWREMCRQQKWPGTSERGMLLILGGVVARKHNDCDASSGRVNENDRRRLMKTGEGDNQMGAKKRQRVEHTEELRWDQLELLMDQPEQVECEEIRPIVV